RPNMQTREDPRHVSTSISRELKHRPKPASNIPAGTGEKNGTKHTSSLTAHGTWISRECNRDSPPDPSTGRNPTFQLGSDYANNESATTSPSKLTREITQRSNRISDKR